MGDTIHVLLKVAHEHGITARVQTFGLVLVGCLLTLIGFDGGCMQLTFGS